MRRAQRLHFGPYKPPPFKVGREVQCAIRGKVKVAGVSKGPIPWPVCRPSVKASIILCGDLVKAVRMECIEAVMHHWGVSDGTVRKWRRALDVPMHNPGTKILRAPLYKNPRRGKLIAASKRGKPRPPEVREKIRTALKKYYGTLP